MTDFELDPDERDDDFPYDYAYVHEETGRLWPVVLGVTLLIILTAGYVWEDRYTRPPKVATAPKYEYAQYRMGKFASIGMTGHDSSTWVTYVCLGDGLPCRGSRSDRFGDSCDQTWWPVVLTAEHLRLRWEDCR